MNFAHPDFPNSSIEHFHITSPPTPDYNCIAWAYGDNTKWYWPMSDFSFWPNDIEQEVMLSSFISLFSKQGYAVCDSDELEIGFEKVAIYSDKQGVPTHAARQLNDGTWTSKLGMLFDVSHTIYSIDGGAYGSICTCLKRQI